MHKYKAELEEMTLAVKFLDSSLTSGLQSNMRWPRKLSPTTHVVFQPDLFTCNLPYAAYRHVVMKNLIQLVGQVM